MPSELVGSEGIPEEHAVTNELKEILGQAIGQLTERAKDCGSLLLSRINLEGNRYGYWSI